MKSITQKHIEKFFKEASKSLKGEWILLGGSVLPCLGREIRPTVDIDIAGKSLKGSKYQLELMSIAEKVDLPVESINTAAEFFLRKIDGFEHQLVLLYEKSDFKVYRPNVNLFIKLKLSRMSESDLADCLEFLKFARTSEEALDATSLKRLIQKEIKKADNRKSRLIKLLRNLKN